MALIRRLGRASHGQGLVEYMLLLGLAALVMIGAYSLLGRAVGNVFSNVVENLIDPRQTVLVGNPAGGNSGAAAVNHAGGSFASDAVGDAAGDMAGDAQQGSGGPFSDYDGDHVPDASDNCPAIPNPDQYDADHNSFGDVCDPAASADDSDNDGVDNAVDNCLLVPNPDQANTFGGPAGDRCEDTDSDGVYDAFDNCPITANAMQFDADRDGVGDACDVLNCANLALSAPVDVDQRATVVTLTSIDAQPVWVQQIDFAYTRHNSHTSVAGVAFNNVPLWSGLVPADARGTFTVSRSGAGQMMTGRPTFAAGIFPIALQYDRNNGLALERVTMVVTTGEEATFDGSNGCVLSTP